MNRKDEDMRQLRDYITENEKRKKMKNSSTKELLKAKKHIKDRERDLLKLGEQLKYTRA